MQYLSRFDSVRAFSLSRGSPSTVSTTSPSIGKLLSLRCRLLLHQTAMEQLVVLHQQLLLKQQARLPAILELQPVSQLLIGHRTIMSSRYVVLLTGQRVHVAMYPVQICSLLGARLDCFKRGYTTLALVNGSFSYHGCPCHKPATELGFQGPGHNSSVLGSSSIGSMRCSCPLRHESNETGIKKPLGWSMRAVW
jgi:hypothetical protein